MDMRKRILALLLVFFAGMTASVYAAPGTNCAPPTAQEKAAGLGASGMVCDSDRKAVGNSGSAKQYLETKLTGAAKERGSVSVTRMNPTYACRLAEFLKAADAAGQNIMIFSGWRSGAAQANAVRKSRPGYACTSGASCPHPSGRAADLTFNGVTPKTVASCKTNTACVWAHENADRFKLTFPLMPGRAKITEPWHIEPVERSSVSSNETCEGITGPGTPTKDPFGDRETDGPPSAPITSNLRELIQPQPTPPQQPTLPQQPLPQQQPLAQAFQPTPQASASPASGGQPGAPVGTPTSVGSSGSGSTAIGSIADIAKTDGGTAFDAAMEEQKPSIADQLLSLAYGTSSIGTATEIATTVPIIVSGKDAAALKGKTAASSSTTTLTQKGGLSPTTIPSQTFISKDLTYPQGSASADQGEIGSETWMLSVLEAMRNVLVQLLDMLKPFGIRDAIEGNEEHE